MYRADVRLVVDHDPDVSLGGTVFLSIGAGGGLRANNGRYIIVRATHRYDETNKPVTVLHLRRL